MLEIVRMKLFESFVAVRHVENQIERWMNIFIASF